jgi:hypothetical protein
MIDLAPKIQGEVFVNCRIEHFPGYKKYTVADTAVFKDPAWEIQKKRVVTSKPQITENITQSRSINRAKKRVHDISALNKFQYFVTWTLDGKIIERDNPKVIARKLKTFLSNKAKRNKMSYLVVPELHKDGKGLHIHGLISGDFELVDSGKKTKDCKTIFNMPQWLFGFSTCIEISGDKENTAKYMTKYISKDFRKIFGNFYYAGGGVRRIPPTTYENADYNAIDAKPYFVTELGINFKYYTVKEGC